MENCYCYSNSQVCGSGNVSMQLSPGFPRHTSGLNTVKTARFSYGLSIQSNFGKENASNDMG